MHKSLLNFDNMFRRFDFRYSIRGLQSKPRECERRTENKRRNFRSRLLGVTRRAVKIETMIETESTLRLNRKLISCRRSLLLLICAASSFDLSLKILKNRSDCDCNVVSMRDL